MKNKKEKNNNTKIKDKKNKETKRKKKKSGILSKIFLSILIIILLYAGWFTYKTYKNGWGLSGMVATVIGHDEETKKDLKEVKVLILGVSTDLDVELTDTIMIASYNPNAQTANLISIPRDTFTGKNASKAQAWQKLNSVYNVNKNPQDVLDEINKITGLDLENYIIVRTEALIKVVDAIGGVEFNVPIDMDYDDPTQDLHIHLKAGLQLLDGQSSEGLLRWRHSNMKRGVMTTYPAEYGNDDFGRMRTQRDFISALIDQTISAKNIFKIKNLLQIAHENVETNLTYSFIKDYVPYIIDFKTENLQTFVIPGTTPNMDTTNNVSIFVVNSSETKKLINSIFIEPEETPSEISSNSETSSEVATSDKNELILEASTTSIAEQNLTEKSNIKIELLNASGDSDTLEKAKKLLTDKGYKIAKTGTTTSISKTIITNKKSLTDTDLKELKSSLGVGSISNNKSSTSLVDVTIVIGKDFN